MLFPGHLLRSFQNNCPWLLRWSQVWKKKKNTYINKYRIFLEPGLKSGAQYSGGVECERVTLLQRGIHGLMGSKRDEGPTFNFLSHQHHFRLWPGLRWKSMRQGQGLGEDLSQSQPSSWSHSEAFKMLEKWKRCHEGPAHPPWCHLQLKRFYEQLTSLDQTSISDR